MNTTRSFIANSYSRGDITGQPNTYNSVIWDIGGLVGELQNGSIDNAYAQMSVTSTGGRTGGLVGVVYNGLIKNTYAQCGVTGGNGDTASVLSNGTGGLVGFVSNYPEPSYITDSEYTGATVNGIVNVGGLVGRADRQIINRCSAYGVVNGRLNVGGLVGYNGGYISSSHANVSMMALGGSPDRFGGLVGYNAIYADSSQPYQITNSYAKGKVFAPSAPLTGKLIGASGNGSAYYPTFDGKVSAYDLMYDPASECNIYSSNSCSECPETENTDSGSGSICYAGTTGAIPGVIDRSTSADPAVNDNLVWPDFSATFMLTANINGNTTNWLKDLKWSDLNKWFAGKAWSRYENDPTNEFSWVPVGWPTLVTVEAWYNSRPSVWNTSGNHPTLVDYPED